MVVELDDQPLGFEQALESLTEVVAEPVGKEDTRAGGNLFQPRNLPTRQRFLLDAFLEMLREVTKPGGVDVLHGRYHGRPVVLGGNRREGVEHGEVGGPALGRVGPDHIVGRGTLERGVGSIGERLQVAEGVVQWCLAQLRPDPLPRAPCGSRPDPAGVSGRTERGGW